MANLLARSLGVFRSTALVAAIAIFTSAPTAHAAPTLSNLSQDDFDKAIKELSANSSYHSVTGAGTLGSVFGLEVALVGGLTNTPDINATSKRFDASADIGRVPHAALLIGASVPLGFTGELLYFPEMTFSGVKYSQFGASVKWTATDLLVLPFNLAVRGFITGNKMSFDQTVSGTAMTVTQENTQTGFQLLASPNIPVVEPYVGVGVINAKGKMSATGTNPIFAFTSAQSAESSPTSTQLLLGVNVNLLVVNLGLEYSSAFGTSSYNAKVGLRF